MQSGLLVYLMGPSGAGKDTLIEAARAGMAARGVEVVQRVITRSAESVGECALGVDIAGFQLLQAKGAFALHWQANGLHYGIPAAIDQCLQSGAGVLVNGSRAALSKALARYPRVLPVLLQVDQNILRERLLARGRETPEQIEQRLARNAQVGTLPGDVVRLDNSGALQRAVQGLLNAVDAALQRS